MIDTVSPWSKGGRERRLAELLERLAAHRFKITVYTMRWWRTQPEGLIAYRAISPRLRLYVGDRRSMLQAACFALGTLRLLVGRFDVILADHMPYLHLFPLRLVAWVRRVPLLVEWHELWGDDYWRQYLGPAGALGAVLERASLYVGDEVVADGSALGRQLDHALLGKRPVTVITNAVDRRRAGEIQPADAAPELLFIGRLIAHKRADVAIDALAQLRAHGADVGLGIVGTGPELEELRSRSMERGVGDFVSFFESVEDHDEVWSLLRGARVLLAPSEREGFGLAVAEALAVGTPVVTVAAPTNEARHLVDDASTGSVVPAGDPDAMASAAAAWLDSPLAREQITHAFWRSHGELDWDASAAAYAELLEQVVASPMASSRRAQPGTRCPSTRSS